jgi:hypothetical protein
VSDRGAGGLLKLAAGLVLILGGVAWVSTGPLGVQVRVAVRQGTVPIVSPGRTMATEVVAARGVPVYVFAVAGDEFWVYESRTHADLQNLADLGRGAPPARNASAAPARLDEVAILRFDRSIGVLTAVYRH